MNSVITNIQEIHSTKNGCRKLSNPSLASNENTLNASDSIQNTNARKLQTSPTLDGIERYGKSLPLTTEGLTTELS